jgi:6-pyruvoyltetrahydropterin/6-carboxytetrahydropterin synthase
VKSLEIVRTVTFSAAHRYASSGLGEEESARVYGSLYRPPGSGFGHNFLVEAAFSGDVDPLTGMIANLVEIDRWLRDVAARFDHKVLNDLPEFAGRAPTLELIAATFFERVAGLASPGVRLISIRLHEGDQTWVDFFG